MICKPQQPLLIGATLIAFAGCGSNAPEASMDEAAAVEGTEWVTLFGGDDLSQWRGYRRDDVPTGWSVEDGTLAFTPGGEGGDIITRDQFGDFELELEWKISPGGNSGIFYRGTEAYDNVWESAPEMQVLDNSRHVDGGDPLTSAGAAYGLYPATTDASRPVGEWNRVRIVARGNHAEHWLNGQKVAEYELDSPDWKERVAQSKFQTMPGYGQARRGHIALQDHGDPVWYRNVRIRALDGQP